MERESERMHTQRVKEYMLVVPFVLLSRLSVIILGSRGDLKFLEEQASFAMLHP